MNSTSSSVSSPSPTTASPTTAKNASPTSISSTIAQNGNAKKDEDKNSIVWRLQEEIEALEPLRDSLPITMHLVEGRLSKLVASALAESTSNANGTDITNGSPRRNTTFGANTLPPSLRKSERINIPTDTGKNLVGRLLGPGGKTLRSIAEKTRCRLAIRGKGSVRPDKIRQYIGTPGFEHLLNDVLHVHIEPDKNVQDWEVDNVLDYAKKTINLYLVPVPEEIDILKKQQLSDLAKMRGFHSDNNNAMTTRPNGKYALPLDENDKLTLEDLAIASSPTLGIHSPPPPSTSRTFYQHHTGIYTDLSMLGPDAFSPVSMSPTAPASYPQYAIHNAASESYFVGNDPRSLAYDPNASYGEPVSPAAGFSILSQRSNSHSANMISNSGPKSQGAAGSPLNSSDLSPEPQTASTFRRTKSAHSVSFEKSRQSFDRAIGSSASKRK